MNIEPICKKAMEFLREQCPFFPSLGTVSNIGEISEIEWYEGIPPGIKKVGSLFITNDESKVVGFKRVSFGSH